MDEIMRIKENIWVIVNINKKILIEQNWAKFLKGSTI